MVRTPQEIRQSLVELMSDLRRSTEKNRDEISKDPDAKRLHRRLSNAVDTLNKAIDELTSQEDGESGE